MFDLITLRKRYGIDDVKAAPSAPLRVDIIDCEADIGRWERQKAAETDEDDEYECPGEQVDYDIEAEAEAKVPSHILRRRARGISPHPSLLRRVTTS